MPSFSAMTATMPPIVPGSGGTEEILREMTLLFKIMGT